MGSDTLGVEPKKAPIDEAMSDLQGQASVVLEVAKQVAERFETVLGPTESTPAADKNNGRSGSPLASLIRDQTETIRQTTALLRSLCERCEL